MIIISRINVDFFDQVVDLVDQYRVFYGQDSDKVRVGAFMRQVMSRNESILYGAIDDSRKIIGFVQLYVSYSTVALAPLWILNDLYVELGSRKQGVATKLIQHALLEAQVLGVKKVLLETHNTNIIAQQLYEQLGFVRDEHSYFYTYDVAKEQHIHLAAEPC